MCATTVISDKLSTSSFICRTANARQMALAMETDVGPITRPSAAVAIRDAYKMYPSKIVVFKGLNMTVPKGTM